MNRNIEKINRNIVGWIAPHVLYKINIDKNSEENARNTREYLLNNKETSYIIYWNHTTLTDFIGGSCAQKLIDPNTPRNLITLVSYSHIEKESKTKKMMTLANKCGFEVVPTIQAYQENNYLNTQVIENYKNILKRFYCLSESQNPTGLLIAPEGHRSTDGKLGKIENGVIKLGEILEPVVYIPVRIDFEKGYNRDGLNFGMNVEIQIRERFHWKKGEAKIKASDLRNRLE
jgi:hypothetical protein